MSSEQDTPKPGATSSASKPPASSTESSMTDDVRTVGDKDKGHLDPKHAAFNAAAALTGAKPHIEAAKTASNTAEADDQASQGESSASSTDPSSAGASPVTPGGGRRGLLDSKHGAHGAQGAQGADGLGGSGASEEVLDSKTGKPTTGGPVTGSGTPAGGGKRALAREGTAKGLDAIGKSVGASKAGQYARKSESDGSVKGDANEVASGAVTGAKIGAAFAGVGAPIGAIAGGLVQGAKTKNGRRALVLMLLAPFLPVIIIMTLLVSMMVFISPATMDAVESGPDEVSMSAATVDGVEQSAITIYQEAGEDSGVPWQVLAAIVEKTSGDHASDEVKPLSADEAKQARDDDEPIGPYSMLLGSLDDIVYFSDDDASGEYALGLNGHENEAELNRYMVDLREASAIAAPLLGSILSDRHNYLPSFDLSAGVELAEPSEDDRDLGRAYIQDDSTEDGLDGEDDGEALDQNGNSTSLSTGNLEAEQLREAYLDAIALMPVEEAEVNAEDIFDQAMDWYFGKSAACESTPATSGAEGGWANPVSGTVSSPFGMRFHPVRHVMSLHDGTDVSAPGGTQIFAASSGTVSAVGGRDGSWGGPYTVVIDHGDGIQTVYGHNSAASVKVGDEVPAGAPIASVGTLGYSTGNHLHFTIRDGGEPIDPVPFMKQRGVTLGTDPAGQVVDDTDSASPPATPTTSPPATPTPTSPPATPTPTSPPATPTPTSPPATPTPTSPPATPTPTSPPATDPEGSQTGTLPESWTGKSAQGETVTLDRRQLEYASQVSAKGVEMAVPDDGLIIAFMTVFVETKWKNYASDVYPETIGHEYPSGAVGSDHDSVGLFQQRPQSGWGQPMELLDPDYAASAFFGGPSGPNGGSPMGLLDHPGWESRAKGEVAQDVQVSAFPDKYAYWETAATELLGVVKGTATTDSSSPCLGSGDGVGGFTIAALNVLGHSHTAPGGDRKGWPQSETRTPQALELLETSGVSVAGVSEFEEIQHEQVREHGGWSLYPETAHQTANSVIWQTEAWTLVEGKQFDIPYFHGIPKAQSYVRLRNNATQEEIWVISIHNPADVAGNAQKWRDEALQIEKDLVETLEGTGLPVFLLGDFNEVSNTYCTLKDLMTSANGAGTESPCRAPEGTGVDQIFVSGETQFASHKVDWTSKDNQITDHPLVTAVVGQATEGAQGAIDYALAQVGKGYSQATPPGRMGPTHFDCSGLVYMAYKQVGVTLGTYTGTQQADGKKVGAGELQPGDLIFYYSPISHVAIYLGDYNGVESIVHAANPRSGVEVSPRSYMQGSEVMYRRVQ